MRRYYWLLLLTATRRNELLEAKWDHVDLEQRELFLPDKKRKWSYCSPLRARISDACRPTETRRESVGILQPYRGQRIKEVNQRWRRVRKQAELEDVQLHDFRRKTHILP